MFSVNMNRHQIKRELTHAENVLNHDHYDFSAKYLAVCRIHTLARTSPEMIQPETVTSLGRIFHNKTVNHETQSYFLFKEAAGALCSLFTYPGNRSLIRKTHDVMMGLLSAMTGRAQRAAAEALGALPFFIEGPHLKPKMEKPSPLLSWRTFLAETGVTLTHMPLFMGRSLVAETNKEDHVLVIKLAGERDDPESLVHEAVWLHHLMHNGYVFPERFNIPEMVPVQGRFLFRLEDIPIQPPRKTRLHAKSFAIAFLAHPDYFRYPNEDNEKKQLTPEAFRETMCRNAFLFGKLTGLGIIHSAPIPLFHNRVQGHRRNDHGRYLWQRAGRLDRWLGSCRHPNFGCSGIRDFEHLEAYRGPARKTYSPMGAQLLSLFLVAGSYFRMKERSRVGFEPNGRPVDARGLFNKPFLEKIIQGIFHHYYRGFVGKNFKGPVPADFSSLADRMVDEMGVDRYMEETLRVADQKEMTDKAFVDFLVERRVPTKKSG